jgi:hypothetical protein
MSQNGKMMGSKLYFRRINSKTCVLKIQKHLMHVESRGILIKGGAENNKVIHVVVNKLKMGAPVAIPKGTQQNSNKFRSVANAMHWQDLSDKGI